MQREFVDYILTSLPLICKDLQQMQQPFPKHAANAGVLKIQGCIQNSWLLL